MMYVYMKWWDGPLSEQHPLPPLPPRTWPPPSRGDLIVSGTGSWEVAKVEWDYKYEKITVYVTNYQERVDFYEEYRTQHL